MAYTAGKFVGQVWGHDQPARNQGHQFSARSCHWGVVVTKERRASRGGCQLTEFASGGIIWPACMKYAVKSKRCSYDSRAPLMDDRPRDLWKRACWLGLPVPERPAGL